MNSVRFGHFPIVPLLAIVSSSKLQDLHIAYFKTENYTYMEFEMFTTNIFTEKVFKEKVPKWINECNARRGWFKYGLKERKG